jgi:hypothetical protein
VPVTYTIKGDLLRLDLVGQYEPNDIIRQFLEGLHDPRCPDTVALLLDVTRSEVLATRSADEIRRVAEFLGPYASRIRGQCALVATADVHYGLSRMGAVSSERVGVEARPFRNLDAALQWLGVSSSAPDTGAAG